jgi:hypothetical protein
MMQVASPILKNGTGRKSTELTIPFRKKEFEMNKTKRSETDLKTWTAPELKKRAVALHSAIYQSECFASHDLLEYDAVKAELESRGYECIETGSFSIVKRGLPCKCSNS